MSDGPEWFEPKRYGYGFGPPIAWQGWLLLAAYLAAVALATCLLGHSPLALAGLMFPLTAVLILVASRTTRGGWRWRWGKYD